MTGPGHNRKISALVGVAPYDDPSGQRPRRKNTAGANAIVRRQGALGWLWGRSPNAIPIPGFRNVKQAEENCGAVELGPLTPTRMREIEQILGRVKRLTDDRPRSLAGKGQLNAQRPALLVA